ncbi:hypothetical protein Taro_036723, partial [Colocasia esculenta]|nr:hypothetical protein [Colocasia esculenta]
MQTSGSLAGAREVCGFPARFVCVLQEGCSCCYVACLASVDARCVRVVVARLAVDSLAVAFLVWRMVTGKSRCSRSSSLLVLVEVEVHRLVALCFGKGLRLFWLVCSSGFSQNYALVVLVEFLAEVLPRSALYLFRATVVLPLWFEVCRLVGLRS